MTQRVSEAPTTLCPNVQRDRGVIGGAETEGGGEAMNQLLVILLAAGAFLMYSDAGFMLGAVILTLIFAVGAWGMKGTKGG